VDRINKRLDLLLRERARSPIAAAQGTPDGLIASLQLSLERLDAEQRRAVARLGVFQGGAFEDDLLAITQLGQWKGDGQQREQLQWLLTALEGGDPRALLQLIGQQLPEGAEPPAELLQQLSQSEELQGLIQQLRAQLAAMPAAAPGSGAEPVTAIYPSSGSCPDGKMSQHRWPDQGSWRRRGLLLDTDGGMPTAQIPDSPAFGQTEGSVVGQRCRAVRPTGLPVRWQESPWLGS